jgi:signal transduction histidine kinase
VAELPHQRFSRERIRAALRWLSEGPPIEESLRSDFMRWSTDLMGRASPWLIAFFLVTAVGWWPTDLFIFKVIPEAQHAYGWLRGTVGVIHIAALTIGRGIFRRHPVPCGVVLSLGEFTLCGWLLGTIGSLDGPWAHYLYFAPWISLGLVRPLGRRLLGSAALGICALGGYLISAGDQWHHPLLPATVSTMVFAVFFAAVVGHGFWLLLRENFVKQRLIDAQRERLDNFSRELGARVAEQTRDLQVLSRRLDALREEERSWMARELHDALGQELTAVRYGVDLVRTRLPADQSRLDVALRDVNARIGMAHDSIRRILQRLRPRVLDELGLFAALEAMRDAIEDSGLVVTIGIEGAALRLSPERETALYRVAQEAITNVLRHAEARSVEVALRVTGDRCILSVADDGIGLAAAPPSADGAGCIGIRERIGALGGTARWHSRPGGGTLVEVELPLELPLELPSELPLELPSELPPNRPLES